MNNAPYFILTERLIMKESFSSKQEWIDAVAGAAQKACKRYGYLPSVLIAQSCL